jgi:hypothetical protein
LAGVFLAINPVLNLYLPRCFLDEQYIIQSMQVYYIKKYTLFVLALFPILLAAQPPGNTSPTPRSSGSQTEVELDTFDIFYFYAENPNQEIPYSDSTLGNYYRQYDPVRKRMLDYRHLGNLGSAHEPIVFQPATRRGFDVGLNQFNLYHVTGRALSFYRIQRPISIVSYTLGSEQADGYLTARFSRNFANGLNYSLDYRRINQLGEREQYPNQNTRDIAFSNGMSYKSENNKYEAFFSYSANTIEQEDNGGLLEEPVAGEEFTSASAAEVFLPDARTRHAHREFMYTHYYRFGGGVDSIKGNLRSFTISHQAILNNSSYKYYDEYSVNQDSSFYNAYPALLPDPRGNRLFFRHRKLENSLRLATFKLSDSKAKNQRDLLEVGAVQSIHWLTQTRADSTINNLFLTGRYRFNPNQRLLIDLSGHFGVWDNAGDYRLSGVLYFDFNKLGRLKLEGLNQLYEPNLMQHRLYLSEQLVYNNNFDKTLSTSIAATYELPAFQLMASGRYHLLNNFIYFDTNGLPVQTGVPLSIAQLIVQKNFSFGPVHLDNTVALQQASEDFIRLPAIYSKHSLYYSGFWFKVLNVRLGFDARMNDSYFAHYYNPVIGQFQLQDRRSVDFYPAIDAFFTFRVTKFRFFFKWENATSVLLNDQFYYQTAFYAHPSQAVRIGIKWRFLN